MISYEYNEKKNPCFLARSKQDKSEQKKIKHKNKNVKETCQR